MEKFLLDTCTWIEFFHERNGVPEHARKAGRENLCASEVTLAEWPWLRILYLIVNCANTFRQPSGAEGWRIVS